MLGPHRVVDDVQVLVELQRVPDRVPRLQVVERHVHALRGYESSDEPVDVLGESLSVIVAKSSLMPASSSEKLP
jgi:hypothetical protein